MCLILFVLDQRKMLDSLFLFNFLMFFSGKTVAHIACMLDGFFLEMCVETNKNFPWSVFFNWYNVSQFKVFEQFQPLKGSWTAFVFNFVLFSEVHL